MKKNKITTLLATLTISAVLAGCAVDGITTITPPPPQPETIIQAVTYKPFADDHNNKFSLGDFDSPYLLRVPSGFTNFVASNSSILLNDITNEVVKTDYQGGVYLGIAGFSFSDYTDFISTNAILTIQVNLVEANGTYTLSNETIASALMVTKATNLYTWQDLQGMQHNLAGGYQLMNDITFPDKDSEGLPPEGFDPVGDDNAGNNFTGSFNGNEHTITNLSIERPTRNLVGIWGLVNDGNSVIKDFVLDHAGIRGDNSVGGVVGLLQSGMVSNVGVVSSQDRSVSGTGGRVGGLAGFNFGTVNGYVTGVVSGNNEIGGLVGANSGTVAGYATGDVTGNFTVGGLVGNNEGGTVNGYATGRVSGNNNNNTGGLVGNNAGTVNGYWDIASSMRNNSDGGVGISSITNVVYDSGAGTYTDDKGTADAMDDIAVFDNMAFTNSFTLPGASATWPTLNAASSFPQP